MPDAQSTSPLEAPAQRDQPPQEPPPGPPSPRTPTSAFTAITVTPRRPGSCCSTCAPTGRGRGVSRVSRDYFKLDLGVLRPDRWFFQPGSARTLAAVRIGLCALLALRVGL